MKAQKKGAPPSTWILILMISYASVSAVLFTPALPFIATDFHTSNSITQFSIALFLVGYAVGQLFFGPLANAIGRVSALRFGLSIALAGEVLSLIAGFNMSMTLLMIGRLITALGACSGFTLTLIMINDVYPLKESRKILATVILSFAVAPGIAIATGSLLVAHFNWCSCFYFLTGYGTLLLFLTYQLNETGAHLVKQPIALGRLMKHYYRQFNDPLFCIYSLCGGLIGAFLYLYYTDAPFIAAQEYHMSSKHYGTASIITSVGYLLGNLAARTLAKVQSAQHVILDGLVIILGGLIFLAFLSTHITTWQYGFFISIGICFVGVAMVYSNITAMALHGAKNASIAASLFGCTSVFGPIIAVTTLSIMGSTSLATFFDIYALMFLSLVCFFGVSYKMTSSQASH